MFLPLPLDQPTDRNRRSTGSSVKARCGKKSTVPDSTAEIAAACSCGASTAPQSGTCISIKGEVTLADCSRSRSAVVLDDMPVLLNFLLDCHSGFLNHLLPFMVF